MSFQVTQRSVFIFSLQHCTTGQLLYLEVEMDALKELGIVRQLVTDVLGVGEDALQVSPGALHSQPGANHEVRQHQPPLPATHLDQKVLHVLAHQDILQLDLHRHTHLYFDFASYPSVISCSF